MHIKLFSQRKSKGAELRVRELIYDTVPLTLRVQVVHIMREAFGQSKYYNALIQHVYHTVVTALRKEYGVFTLSPQNRDPDDQRNSREELIDFLVNGASHEQALDCIELILVTIETVTGEYDYCGRPNAEAMAKEAIADINARFEQHALGFRFIEGALKRLPGPRSRPSNFVSLDRLHQTSETVRIARESLKRNFDSQASHAVTEAIFELLDSCRQSGDVMTSGPQYQDPAQSADSARAAVGFTVLGQLIDAILQERKEAGELGDLSPAAFAHLFDAIASMTQFLEEVVRPDNAVAHQLSHGSLATLGS